MLIILLPFVFILIYSLWINQRSQIDPVLTDKGEEHSGVSLIRFHPIYKKCKKYRKLLNEHKISDTEYQKRKDEILEYWMGDDVHKRGISRNDDGIVRIEKKNQKNRPEQGVWPGGRYEKTLKTRTKPYIKTCALTQTPHRNMPTSKPNTTP